MEGDAGASRLTPNDPDDSSSAEVETDQITSEAQDSLDSPVDAEHEAGEPTTEDSAESEGPSDRELTASGAEDLADSAEHADDAPGASRLGRGWFVGIAAVLVVLAGGIGAGGYLALRSQQDSLKTARNDAAALEAAKTCVAATQAPDTTAMAASAQKIVECGSGAFRSQALLYSGLLVEAYQAANAHVEVSDLRAAVERNNPDGSIDILIPLRVKVSNSEAQNQEAGYRLRVTMVSDDGQYRISKLDQVAR
jgi:Mce-associated membrane protein